MPKFICKFNPIKNFKFVPVLDVSVDEKGNKVLVQTGQVEQQKIIQSFADSCSIARIVARYNLGDDSALQSREGVYLSKEVAESLIKDKFENQKTLAGVYDSLYSTLKGKYDLSKKEMIELIRAGKVDEIEKHIIKEGGAE